MHLFIWLLSKYFRNTWGLEQISLCPTHTIFFLIEEKKSETEELQRKASKTYWRNLSYPPPHCSPLLAASEGLSQQLSPLRLPHGTELQQPTPTVPLTVWHLLFTGVSLVLPEIVFSGFLGTWGHMSKFRKRVCAGVLLAGSTESQVGQDDQSELC